MGYEKGLSCKRRLAEENALNIPPIFINNQLIYVMNELTNFLFFSCVINDNDKFGAVLQKLLYCLFWE